MNIIFNRKNISSLLIIVIIISIGFYFRIAGINSRSLEYDEIWTLRYYSSKPVKKIFTKFKTPNNHPLNSLLIKSSTNLLGKTNFAVRLPALVSGFLLILTVALITLLLFKNIWIVILSTALCCFNGALIHYSQTGRGYELQTMLVALYLLVILLLEKTTKFKNLYYLLLIIIPSLAILTLPTSILFIFPLAVIHLIYKLFFTEKTKILEKTKNNKTLIYVYLALGLLCSFWYIYNYSSFKAGQSFGTNITTSKEFILFCFNIIKKLSGYWLIILSILLLFINRKYLKLGISFLIILFFVLFSSIFLKAGPPRVYIPLIPFIIICSSGGIYLFIDKYISKKLAYIASSILIVVTLCLLPLSIADWTPNDFPKLYNNIAAKMPKNYYICLPATDGFPTVHNNREIIATNFIRTSKNTTHFANLFTPKILSGIQVTGQTKSIQIPSFVKNKKINIDEKSVFLYRLKKIKLNTKAKIVLAFVPPINKRYVYQAIAYIVNKNITNWLLLNCWFTKSPLLNASNIKLTTAVLASSKSQFTNKQMLEIEKKSRGKILFYSLESYQADSL